MKQYELSQDQLYWAKKQRWKIPPRDLREMLISQRGKCALSGASLLFDVSLRTPKAGGLGCHPLTPAVDHIAPGTREQGFQIVCYALNDIKGPLPFKCYRALIDTPEWKRFMKAWAAQAAKNPRSRKAFQNIVLQA